MNRHQIASYGPDRILVADLCDRNQDEWVAGELMNLADLVARGVVGKPWQFARMRGSDYCVEVEPVSGGFLAYEVELDILPYLKEGDS